MNYKNWVDLFGKPADDRQVLDAIADAGITKVIKIGRDELSVSADIKGKGITITFTDETILYPDAEGIVGRPILSGILMIIQHPNKANLYTDALPYQLKKEDSKSTLREKSGTPLESNEELGWDSWMIDGLKLVVTYARDLKSLNRVSLSFQGNR